MTEFHKTIQSHYDLDNIVGRILEALGDAGYQIDKPTVKMLQQVDQLHGGGLKSTVRLAELAGITSGLHVLDAGCGIGGAARFFVDMFDCRVEAMDLSPDFVEAANELTALCRLSDRISYHRGSVTNLPYGDRTFDMVWSQNVSMNVDNKTNMFTEAFRVLKLGGRYAVSHAAQGTGGKPIYPLPWARKPSHSFLDTPEGLIAKLKAAGFRIVEYINDKGSKPSANKAPRSSTIGLTPVMGDDFPERMANSIRSSREGRIVGMLVVAERPG